MVAGQPSCLLPRVVGGGWELPIIKNLGDSLDETQNKRRSKKMKLREKLLVSFLVIILINAILGGVIYTKFSNVASNIDEVINDHAPAEQHIMDMRIALGWLFSAHAGYVEGAGVYKETLASGGTVAEAEAAAEPFYEHASIEMEEHDQTLHEAADRLAESGYFGSAGVEHEHEGEEHEDEGEEHEGEEHEGEEHEDEHEGEEHDHAADVDFELHEGEQHAEDIAMLLDMHHEVVDYMYQLEEEMRAADWEEAEETRELLHSAAYTADAALAQVENLIDSRVLDAQTSTDDMASNGKTMVIICIVVSFVVGVLLALVLATMITGPVKKLTKAANEISRGDIDAKMPEIKSKDEIGDLGKSFGRMVTAYRFMAQDEEE